MLIYRFLQMTDEFKTQLKEPTSAPPRFPLSKARYFSGVFGHFQLEDKTLNTFTQNKLSINGFVPYKRHGLFGAVHSLHQSFLVGC